MKKVILSICVLALVLCACAQKNNPPAENTVTSFDAVYTTGDFSFNCNIKWQNNTAYVTVTSTQAQGLTLSCDGRNVTFTKGEMIKRESKENIDSSNPALLLWEIFTALENGDDKSSLGTFTVEKSEGKIKKITVSDITVTAIN